MALFSDTERNVLEAVASLANGNPFLPERVEAERGALGKDFVATAAVWHVEADLNGLNPNVPKLGQLVESFGKEVRERLAKQHKVGRRELELYQMLVFYLLYQRYEHDWRGLIDAAERTLKRKIGFFDRFANDVEFFFGLGGIEFTQPVDAAFLFALGFQMRRAFHHTFRQIYGGSMPAARLRAEIWNSIFTHDAARYRRGLYSRMGDIPTLVVGESGTGKELAARAIALSRFIPFDAKKGAFVADYAEGFHGLNLSALSPTLIESELFGHKRGAFTGALEDRAGWLQSCGPWGSVFLDEVGDVDAGVQVKLLRVLQTRGFQRIGETKELRFEGKIIAATHQDLGQEMEAGRFRQDFYYRLCADVVRTPTLREQLGGSRDELRSLVFVLAKRLVDAEEVEGLTDTSVKFIEQNLGLDYLWPGNVRELEQCVRSILVRNEYRPPQQTAAAASPSLAAMLAAGGLSADELLKLYCTQVYQQSGSYEEAARRLGLDRRTVKAKVDPALSDQLND